MSGDMIRGFFIGYNVAVLSGVLYVFILNRKLDSFLCRSCNKSIGKKIQNLRIIRRCFAVSSVKGPTQWIIF